MKCPSYPKYKPSGVDWLGEVPEKWITVETKFAYSIQLGKMLQPESASDNDVETSYLKAQHVQWEKVRISDLPTMWASAGDLVKYSVADGDLLVCEGGDVGRSGIVFDPPEGAIIQNALHRVREKKGNNTRFLMYLTEVAASQGWFEILCNKSTIAHFTGEKFGAMKIVLPASSEQCSIANFIDKETGRLDTLVEKKRQMIELLKEKRTALISHAVTKGLDQKVKMKDSGIEWLGDVPAHWEVMTLKRIVSVPITDGPHETPEILDDGVPFVSAEAVRNNKIDFSKIRGFISRQDHLRYALKYRPQRDDIYIIKSGATTGNLAIVDTDKEFNIWSPLAAIRANKKVAYPKYVLYALNSTEFQTSVQLFWSYGTQQNIGMNVIENLVMPVPSISEQRAIANFLDRETSKIDRMIEKVEAAIEKLIEYRAALITAAVTGKIDVRGVA